MIHRWSKGLALTLIFAFVGGIASAQTKYVDGVVAVINSRVVTVYDVGVFALQEEHLIRSRYTPEDLKNESVRKEMFAEIERARKDAAQRLIEQELIHAEFVGKGFSVPNEYLERRMDRIVAGPPYNGDWGKFEDSLEENESTIDEFRERLTRRLSVQMLTDKEVNRKVAVTPQQVQQYWLESKERMARPKKVRLSMLEVRHARHKNSEERITAVEQAVAAGKDFAGIVGEISDGPNRGGGGDIGWQEVAKMRPEFRDGLGNFEKGKVSDALSLSGSTYFLKVTDSEITEMPSFELVQDKLENELYARERQRRFKNWVDGLRQKAYVRVFFKD